MGNISDICGGTSETVSGFVDGVMNIVQIPITMAKSIMETCGGITGK